MGKSEQKVTIYGCKFDTFRNPKKVYYWTNPKALQLEIGDSVKVYSSKTHKEIVGKITSIINCDMEDVPNFSKHSYSAMKPISSKCEEVRVALKDIIIPPHFGKPNEKKMESRRAFYNRYSQPYSPIYARLENGKYYLEDGYITYLILQEKKKVSVKVRVK